MPLTKNAGCDKRALRLVQHIMGYVHTYTSDIFKAKYSRKNVEYVSPHHLCNLSINWPLAAKQ